MCMKCKSLIYSVVVCLLVLASYPVNAREYQYVKDEQTFSNPDRGWYSYAPILDNDSYADIGNGGGRLVYGAITLDEFIHRDISTTVLEKITQRFAELRASGVKAVLRVNYNEETTGTDANMNQMVRHMAQLKPLLAANSDVIAYIEMGYFGQWGEWHDWCNGQANNDLTDDFCSKHLDNVDTWRRLIAEQLAHAPADRFLMIRYPAKKQAVFDGEPLTSGEAYGSSGKARIGHHNDCFLASPDDMGTYQTFDSSPPLSVTELKAYVAEETDHLPMGGETCSATSGHRFDCTTAVAEMEQLHWTYLNQDYYGGALDIWKRDGCFDTIDRRLGYRFELRSATVPDRLEKGTSQRVHLTLHNFGFARAHYQRKAYLRLLRGSKTVATLELENVDLRSIAPGETLTLEGTFTMPSQLLEEPVDVALWLPDNDSRNWNNSRFSIRLAYVQNEGDWNGIASAGHNLLVTDVPVSQGQSSETPSRPTKLRILDP